MVTSPMEARMISKMNRWGAHSQIVAFLFNAGIASRLFFYYITDSK
jgi:hypothetical protein